MPSLVKPIPIDKIPTMETKRLLAYLNKLRACEESVADSDIGSIHTNPENPGMVIHRVVPEDIEREVNPNTIRFKDDPRWIELYEAIKLELANREHVPGGGEKKKD